MHGHVGVRSTVIKLAISGACGKMGRRIIELAKADKAFGVAALIETKGHPDIGKGLAGVKIQDTMAAVKAADVLIEFTTPQATVSHLVDCVGFSIPIVIGTTGLSDSQLSQIKSASEKIPIVFSPNMSVGVNCLFGLVRAAAQKLPSDYSVRIVEAHHAHKKDAPSGTAKRLAQIIKDQTGADVGDIKAAREGEIVGDHRVIFESPTDRLELFHSAKTRDIFALGALKAAKFVIGKNPGFYSMEDVL